ncbi:barstar family protein [Stenotrophomonas rhizophila]
MQALNIGATIRLDFTPVTRWDEYHDAFVAAFGLPAFYGRNGHALLDCLSSLRDPDAGMSRVVVAPGEVVLVQVDGLAAMLRESFIMTLELLSERCAAREQSSPIVLMII